MQRLASRARSFVAAWAFRSSLARSAAVRCAASRSSAAGTTRSRKPASTASSGEKTSARMTARLKCAGVSRWRQISIAARGMVRPMATSFAVNLYGPATPIR